MAWLLLHFVIATHTAGSQMLLDCATSTQRPWLHCVCFNQASACSSRSPRRKRSMRLASVLPLGATPFYGSGKLPAHDLRGSTALELSTLDGRLDTLDTCLAENEQKASLGGAPAAKRSHGGPKAVSGDPVPQPIRWVRGSASRIGLKQQNINKEALQAVRPRTWRSVRSTPHQ